jgi:hypothetical protein
MRKDKAVAFKLRRDGKSYREIQKEIKISRSTLCDWFRDEEWSIHIKNINKAENSIKTKSRILKLNEHRKENLRVLYQEAENKATQEFEVFKNDPLFMAGLMIYSGEGDKRSPNNSRVSNSEFYIHKIFIKFSEKYLNIKKENIKIGLILYGDMDVSVCLKKWSEELDISNSNFYKTQIINGREQKKRLQYGVGISIISSIVVVKKKILKWLELSATLEF